MSDGGYLLVDGERRTVGDGTTIAVVDPATGDVVDTVPRAADSDVADALAAAQRAYQEWRYSPVRERARVLDETARLVRERADHIAVTLTREQGKPLSEAHGEVHQAADTCAWFAGEAERGYGRLVDVDAEHQVRVERRPVGPVAAFTAWNFPAALPARKLAPAVAAGCSVILKPAEEAPRTALLLAEAFADAGLPAGVVNVLTGDPAAISTQLLESPVIRKVSLTGSIPVGQELVRQSARHLPPLSLELGGHAPAIVFDDADIDRAVSMCVAAKFRNAGQVCISPSRFLLHERIAEEFTDRFVQATTRLNVGNGSDPRTEVGPLANARRRDAVERLVSDATTRGATVRCGGRRPPHLDSGFFYEPTVLDDVDATMAVSTEEPFGPIAPMTSFTTLEEAVDSANGVRQGLAAYLFTTGLHTATAVTSRLDVGMIGVNEVSLAIPSAPFGGTKLSGYGRENAKEGLEAYTVPTYVNLRF